MTNETKLTLRATEDDLRHVALIADALRASGKPFTTKADAVRFALQTVAASAARGAV